MFLGHVTAIYATIATALAMADSPSRSMGEEGKAGQGHCHMQLDRNFEQVVSPVDGVTMINQRATDTACAAKCSRLEEVFRRSFEKPGSQHSINFQQRSVEETSPPIKPPSCELFCQDTGCPCLLPWADRCRLNSCRDCPECGGTTGTTQTSSTVPPSTTPASTTPPSTTPPSTTPPTTGDCGKDIVIAVDASKSVKQDGWDAEVAFVVALLEAFIPNDTPNTNRVMLYYFNNKMYCVGQVCAENAAGTWMSTKNGLALALQGLDYETGNDKIKKGATDHPQVYITTEAAFSTARPNSERVLIMVTDGVTHEGEGCSSLSQAVLEAKVGKCEGTHACVPGGCDMEKCMCGLYTAELFKEKGFRLDIVGIANQHHIGMTEAGYFKRQMELMASPNKCNVAQDFVDLGGFVPQVVADACSA